MSRAILGAVANHSDPKTCWPFVIIWPIIDWAIQTNRVLQTDHQPSDVRNVWNETLEGGATTLGF